MIEQVFTPLVGGILSLIAGVLGNFVRDLVGRARAKESTATASYSARLSRLTTNLTEATREVDAVLSELSQVSKERANAVLRLEEELNDMANREAELKTRIAALEQTPLAVAEHFAKLVAPGERQSAKRDYVLFGAGVVVSTIIGIVIQLFVT